MRHLRPQVRPVVSPLTDDDTDDVAIEDVVAMEEGLQRLRAPMEHIEKLPKPQWKGAWDGERAGRCNECNGYHVLSNAIHLDYCGHAVVTDRLLDVDPFWDWGPLAYTPDGLPRFDGFGGLWIKLTVLGVTRLGYGDATGKASGTTAVKEIIGDAIRNAAMRFGVALDLWAKIDLHSERNPGDGERRDDSRQARAQRSTGTADQAGARRADPADDASSGAGRAPNADALDALAAVCDEHGFDRRTMRSQYVQWRLGGAVPVDDGAADLADAAPENIFAFAAHLVELDSGGDGGSAGDDDVAEPVPAAGGDPAPGRPDDEVPPVPADDGDGGPAGSDPAGGADVAGGGAGDGDGSDVAAAGADHLDESAVADDAGEQPGIPADGPLF